MNLPAVIRATQTAVGVSPDGQPGEKTWLAIYKAVTGKTWQEAAPVEPVATGWPLERNAAAFFGYPPNLTQIEPPYPMRMFYDSKWHPIRAISCSVKVAASLRRILSAIFEHFERDLSQIRAAGMDVYDGCYNDRSVRGSSRRSMHAYGAAIDFDAEHNPLGATTGRMPAAVVAIFKAEGWRWGGDYTGRKDWMHFEACR